MGSSAPQYARVPGPGAGHRPGARPRARVGPDGLQRRRRVRLLRAGAPQRRRRRAVRHHAGPAPAWYGPVVAAVAEALPFPTGSFDAAMTTFSVHQWGDLEAGLAEMRRVARDQVVVLTCDPDRLERSGWPSTHPRSWPWRPGATRRSTGSARGWGTDGARGGADPVRCADGFNEAYYGRPEALLDRSARRSCSAWSFVPDEVHERFERALGRDLADGSWDRDHGHLRPPGGIRGLAGARGVVARRVTGRATA